MNKRIENIKTFVLLLLILTSILLAAIIWSGDQISGFFSMFQAEKKAAVPSLTELTEVYFGIPESIMLHLDGEKIQLSEEDPYYTHMWTQITESIRIFLSAPNKKAIAVSDDVWQEAIKGNSIFLDFHGQYTTEFFSQIYHSEYKTDGYQFSQLLIRFPSTYSSQYAFLIRDETSGQIYQFYVSDPSLHLSKSVNMVSQNLKNPNFVYSFEVNFDKNSDSSLQTQNVLIDSMVLLNLEEADYHVYEAINPLVHENAELNGSLIQSIAALFQVNAQTMSKYVDENGSITFVENYATLKIHSNGLVEHQVTDETAAPPLTVEGSPAELAADFIGRVLSLTGCHSDLLYNSDLSGKTKTDTFQFGFDYKIDSSPVSLTVDGEAKEAISLEIKDNKLISYQHYLREYRREGGGVRLPASISVIDSALRANHASSAAIPFIDQMYVGYRDGGAFDRAEPCWYVHFQDAETQLINGGQEEP